MPPLLSSSVTSRQWCASACFNPDSAVGRVVAPATTSAACSGATSQPEPHISRPRSGPARAGGQRSALTLPKTNHTAPCGRVVAPATTSAACSGATSQPEPHISRSRALVPALHGPVGQRSALTLPKPNHTASCGRVVAPATTNAACSGATSQPEPHISRPRSGPERAGGQRSALTLPKPNHPALAVGSSRCDDQRRAVAAQPTTRIAPACASVPALPGPVVNPKSPNLPSAVVKRLPAKAESRNLENRNHHPNFSISAFQLCSAHFRFLLSALSRHFSFFISDF